MHLWMKNNALCLFFLFPLFNTFSQSTEFSERRLTVKTDRERLNERRLEYAKGLSDGYYDQIKIAEQVNDFYFVFSAYEQRLLSLLKNEFQLLILFVLWTNEDNTPYEELHIAHNPYGFTRYPRTELVNQIENLFFQNIDDIKSAVEVANLSPAHKDYIVFYINQLEYYKDYSNNEKQFSLVQSANTYKNKYPENPLAEIVTRRHGKYREPRAFALDANVGLSYGFFHGRLGQKFSKIWGFDMDFKFYLHNTFLGGKGHVTFNKTKKEFLANDYHFIDNRRGIAMTYLDVYLGRKVLIDNRLSLLPQIGYSLTEFSIFHGGGDPMHEESWQWTYTNGIYLGLDLQYYFNDANLQRTVFSNFKRKLSYGGGYFRLSSVMRNPNLAQLDNVLKGNSFTFSFGVGAHLRGSKRRDITKKDHFEHNK